MASSARLATSFVMLKAPSRHHMQREGHQLELFEGISLMRLTGHLAFLFDLCLAKMTSEGCLRVRTSHEGTPCLMMPRWGLQLLHGHGHADAAAWTHAQGLL